MRFRVLLVDDDEAALALAAALEGAPYEVRTARSAAEALVVLDREDAWRWMSPKTPVEEAAHIAQTRSIPTEEFMWWKVDRAVNRPDPCNNGRHLLAPVI